MSDDLVRRLRNECVGLGAVDDCTIDEAAARISALEAQLAEANKERGKLIIRLQATYDEPIQAHSKSEYKRLSTLGANVAPPATTRDYRRGFDAGREAAAKVCDGYAKYYGGFEGHLFEDAADEIRSMTCEEDKCAT